MTYARRTDATHATLLRALRDCGWLVADTSRLPSFVDAVIYRPTHGMLLAEFKSGSKDTLTPAQAALQRDGWPFVRLETVEDVEQLTHTRGAHNGRHHRR